MKKFNITYKKSGTKVKRKIPKDGKLRTYCKHSKEYVLTDESHRDLVCVDLMYQVKKRNNYFMNMYLLMCSQYDLDIDCDSIKIVVNYLFNLFREECLDRRLKRIIDYSCGHDNGIDFKGIGNIEWFERYNYNNLFIVKCNESYSHQDWEGNFPMKVTAKYLNKDNEEDDWWAHSKNKSEKECIDKIAMIFHKAT